MRELAGFRFPMLLGLTILLGGGVVGAQDGENLLANPRLEEGILEPAAWGFNTVAGNRVTWQMSAQGDAHAVLLAGSGQDWAGLTSRRVSARAGEGLTVAALVRVMPGQAAEDRDRVYVRFFRPAGFVRQEGPSLAGVSEEWKIVTGVVTVADEADAADVSVQIWSQARVQVAAACLVRGEREQDAARLLGPAPAGGEGWKDIEEAQNVPADADNDGLADALEAFLGTQPGDKAMSARRTRRKTTSFQTPTGYRDDNDLKVDVVIIAGNEEQKIRSWAALGYEPHVMVGFRAGEAYLDGREDGGEHRDEVQTDARGTLLTCGPGSYYMVPTENRRRIFREYFADAVRRGARAACPEEPEFFSRAGHSGAFKREWEAFYREPWQDQAGSVEARFKADRLKVELERKLLQACYEGARSADPKVKRFLLTHSPLNYTAWGVVFGHQDMLATGEVDAVVAQVWTGTARSGVVYEGRGRERTFENAYLEYASCAGLVRDTGIELWFLMDPLEDNPDRSMEDYHTNYERTLAASLMFPEVVNFETMPWPTRIFGRVPDDFATEICSVISVLSDMQNQGEARWDAGPARIGTFLADSAMWQRGAPHASDMNCFYGLTLPLLMRGVPVEVPHLDRAAEPGYLDRYRVLLVSYDMLKPMKPQINEALAEWTRKGGCLIVLGGEDPYNAVPLWWREKGFESPQDHLLSLCGLDVSQRQVSQGLATVGEWQVVAKTDYAGRNLENQTTEEIDLSPFLETGTALVKCEDSIKEDGWGAYITRLQAEGVRDGKRVRIDARPNTREEGALVAFDRDTGISGDTGRFCDGDRYVVYGFRFDPGSRATLRIEIGNQYTVSATAARGGLVRSFTSGAEAPVLGARTVEVPPTDSVVRYEGSGAKALYADAAGELLSERQCGRGTVLFFGASPAWFARSAEGARALRGLVRYAMADKAGEGFHEQGYIKLERGRYTIAKTFDEPLEMRGRYVDVLDANLPIVTQRLLGPDELAVLYDAAPDMSGGPRVLFASSCVEWKAEEEARTRMILSGAKGTYGSCRLYAAGRRIEALRAVAAEAREVKVEARAEVDTVLLRYPNETFGLAVDITWAK